VLIRVIRVPSGHEPNPDHHPDAENMPFDQGDQSDQVISYVHERGPEGDSQRSNRKCLITLITLISKRGGEAAKGSPAGERSAMHGREFMCFCRAKSRLARFTSVNHGSAIGRRPEFAVRDQQRVCRRVVR
jgi:hypothetical protein